MFDLLKVAAPVSDTNKPDALAWNPVCIDWGTGRLNLLFKTKPLCQVFYVCLLQKHGQEREVLLKDLRLLRCQSCGIRKTPSLSVSPEK